MNQSPNETSAEQEERVELSESDRHRLLASKRRRAVIDLLENRSIPIDLEELAAGIVERGEDTAAPKREQIEQVAIVLHHIHLPKMADMGVIDYDVESNRVELVRVLP